MTEVRPRSPRSVRTGYLPSLDGWRAIAVIGVMMTHDRSWVIFGHSLSTAMGYGGYGVYLFFAISGFLITTRILEEEAICGQFDIRRFYIRRVFRIQPAALVYLAVVSVVMLAGLSRDSWFSWVSALCLFTNFTWHPWSVPTLTGHFWTLAVEEHFYILLSVTLWMVKRYRATALAVLLTGFTLPLVASYGIRHGWYLPANTPRSTQWQLTPLLLASLVAVMLRRKVLLRLVKAMLYPWVAFAGTLGIIVGKLVYAELRYHLTFEPLHHLPDMYPFAATYLLILWIVATVFHPDSWTTRVLELGWMRFIGRISYSLYLWHVLVFYLWTLIFFTPKAPLGHLIQHGGVLSWLEMPAKYAAIFIVATLSYYTIERPLIRMGHRLAPPATPGRPELADLPSSGSQG